MQAWYARGGPEDGLARGVVEEYMLRMTETEYEIMLRAAGL